MNPNIAAILDIFRLISGAAAVGINVLPVLANAVSDIKALLQERGQAVDTMALDRAMAEDDQIIARARMEQSLES